MRAVIIHLGPPLLTASSSLPSDSGGPPSIIRADIPRLTLKYVLLPCSEWGLPSRPSHLGRWCALTAPFHPYRSASFRPKSVHCGGLFSVALSRESPRVAVSNHPARWSPDFPRLQACADVPPVPEVAITRPSRSHCVQLIAVMRPKQDPRWRRVPATRRILGIRQLRPMAGQRIRR